MSILIGQEQLCWKSILRTKFYSIKSVEISPLNFKFERNLNNRSISTQVKELTRIEKCATKLNIFTVYVKIFRSIIASKCNDTINDEIHVSL